MPSVAHLTSYLTTQGSSQQDGTDHAASNGSEGNTGGRVRAPLTAPLGPESLLSRPYGPSVLGTRPSRASPHPQTAPHPLTARRRGAEFGKPPRADPTGRRRQERAGASTGTAAKKRVTSAHPRVPAPTGWTFPPARLCCEPRAAPRGRRRRRKRRKRTQPSAPVAAPPSAPRWRSLRPVQGRGAAMQISRLSQPIDG